MRKRLSYRRAKKGIAEQYSISINQDIIRSLGITESNRTIDLYYDRATKKVIIRKVEE
ncbi:hypothetical protein [uncultured Fusobacterium sp.]|uniref:hypothetical protein n=1 Tax=uncultured Fusobacterium sp. TaxID=159267 RepID=UPI00265FAC7B|nr:hypothetical protein [uncultured Fusobacterium sp.]